MRVVWTMLEHCDAVLVPPPWPQSGEDVAVVTVTMDERGVALIAQYADRRADLRETGDGGWDVVEVTTAHAG